MQRRLVAAATFLLLAAAGYFLYAGIVRFRAPALGDAQAERVLARWRQPGAAASALERQPRDARAIITRNPFDSVTGPLTGVPIPELPKPKESVEISDPLAAPRCDDVRVYSTIRYPDVRRSTAVAQLKDQHQSRIVQVGDVLGDMQLAYIGFNRRELSPSVWFLDDHELCQTLVFTDRPRFKSAHRQKSKKRRRIRKRKRSKRRRRKARSRKKRARRRKRPPRLPRSVARKLERVGAGEYRIDRGVVDQLISGGTQWLKRTRMVPVKEKGRVVGMRVSNVGKGTLLSKLGLRNGDQIRRINGHEIANPEKALQAYAHLRTASDISVQIHRHGKPVTLDYRIR